MIARILQLLMVDIITVGRENAIGANADLAKTAPLGAPLGAPFGAASVNIQVATTGDSVNAAVDDGPATQGRNAKALISHLR